MSAIFETAALLHYHDDDEYGDDEHDDINEAADVRMMSPSPVEVLAQGNNKTTDNLMKVSRRRSIPRKPNPGRRSYNALEQ